LEKPPVLGSVAERAQILAPWVWVQLSVLPFTAT
jgi:hypothetical protein